MELEPVHSTIANLRDTLEINSNFSRYKTKIFAIYNTGITCTDTYIVTPKLVSSAENLPRNGP